MVVFFLGNVSGSVQLFLLASVLKSPSLSILVKSLIKRFVSLGKSDVVLSLLLRLFVDLL